MILLGTFQFFLGVATVAISLICAAFSCQENSVHDAMTFRAGQKASVNRSRSWQKGISILASAISHATQANTASYNLAIHTFETASQWAKAFDLLHRLASWKLRFSVVSYNTAISACRYRSEWRSAVHLLGSLTEAHLKCNQITLSAAIVACSHRKWEALSLFDSICKRAMKPNSISYGAVLDACEMLGMTRRVRPSSHFTSFSL